MAIDARPHIEGLCDLIFRKPVEDRSHDGSKDKHRSGVGEGMVKEPSDDVVKDNADQEDDDGKEERILREWLAIFCSRKVAFGGRRGGGGRPGLPKDREKSKESDAGEECPATGGTTT